ncbi:unnamed protein product [Orchesella dallaii]|uniref:Arrestin-like N-terminal domain-containing protein n=1 Tax=Orchesella dallaii TaxID=48710 RepID=A0ABP1QA46_9HEXA
MSLEKFVILLDEPSMQYRPEIILKFKGQVDVRFYDKEGIDKDRELFRNSEEFFNFQKHLMGDGETEISISPWDELTFDFAFQLPSQPLPASFYGRDGKVEYVLEGEVRRSFWKWNLTTLQPITILAELVQQHMSLAKLPSEDVISKTFGFCCCTSGPLFLHVKVPIRGCVPGQSIYFEVEVNNMSRKRIVDLSAQIVQVVFCSQHLYMSFPHRL